MLISLRIREIEAGPMSSTTVRQHLLAKGSFIPITLSLDAMSIYAAVTATFIKQPVEKSLLVHVQYLREFLDKRQITLFLGLTLGICSPTA